MGKGIQLAIATITLFAGLTWFLSTRAGGEGTFAYYENVGSFLANGTPQGPEHRGLRVHGYVVPGSIDKQLEQGHVDFAIEDEVSEGTLPVRFLGIDLPDVFSDGAEVVIEGRVEEGRFLADRVLAKCPSKYEPEVPTESHS